MKYGNKCLWYYLNNNKVLDGLPYELYLKNWIERTVQKGIKSLEYNDMSESTQLLNNDCTEFIVSNTMF